MLKKWDFFICHASEDKADVVEPLATELAAQGATVWYDRWALQIGDSLSAEIDEGLASSEFGVVVLSPHFFAKPWPQRELGGLVQREVEGTKVILPIWHRVDHTFVAAHSPTLADKMAGSTSVGIPILARRLLDAREKRAGSETRIHTQTVVHRDPATLVIGYSKVKITAKLHRYSLTAALTLLSPPDQGRFRLRLLWPEEIRVAKLEHVREGSVKRLDGGNYKDLVVDWEQRVFPRETVQLLGPDSTHGIEYEYDQAIFLFLQTSPRQLQYTLFFEDHPPVAGAKPFGELNIF